MSKMVGINIIIICLIAYDIALTIVCARLFSIISESKFNQIYDRIKIEYFEKQINLNRESIDLLLKSH